MVMHWIGNNNYPWTIPDEKLSDVLEDIFMAVCKQPGDFRNDDGCNLAFTTSISEWRGNFSSTAITILMAFFTSTDEYKTKEAHKEYAEYQLEDSHFAEHALILAHNDLIVEDTSDHGKHKIMLTLNHATNKMNNTGTAFSAEIVERAQPYMKRAHHKGQDEESSILDSQKRLELVDILIFALAYLDYSVSTEIIIHAMSAAQRGLVNCGVGYHCNSRRWDTSEEVKNEINLGLVRMKLNVLSNAH
ncbi:hypothetical protein DFH29DRAFT_881776 [Suillus ampliporus]|nr:hypothetical protein DFH29DRAFT_881776 [Suillus ampliporus]